MKKCELDLCSCAMGGMPQCHDFDGLLQTPQTEEKQEPDAWMHKNGVDFISKRVREIWLKVRPSQVENYVTPLYTHPMRELTVEEIDSVVHELRQKSFDPKRWIDVYTVAIETIIQLRDELRKARE